MLINAFAFLYMAVSSTQQRQCRDGGCGGRGMHGQEAASLSSAQHCCQIILIKIVVSKKYLLISCSHYQFIVISPYIIC